jgi:hypothetical protein
VASIVGCKRNRIVLWRKLSSCVELYHKASSDASARISGGAHSLPHQPCTRDHCFDHLSITLPSNVSCSVVRLTMLAQLNFLFRAIMPSDGSTEGWSSEGAHEVVGLCISILRHSPQGHPRTPEHQQPMAVRAIILSLRRRHNDKLTASVVRNTSLVELSNGCFPSLLSAGHMVLGGRATVAVGCDGQVPLIHST